MAARQAATSTSGRSAESHQQRTGTEVLQHVRNAACAESDGFNAASIDVAFVDDGRIQVASHIDRTSRDQVKAPRHSAENRQRAGFLAASPDQRCSLLLWWSRQKSRTDPGEYDPVHQPGAFSLLTITPVILVFFAPPKLLRVSSIRSFSCSGGVSALRHNEDDFCVQRF